jgi:hypothetical protein
LKSRRATAAPKASRQKSGRERSRRQPAEEPPGQAAAVVQDNGMTPKSGNRFSDKVMPRQKRRLCSGRDLAI